MVMALEGWSQRLIDRVAGNTALASAALLLLVALAAVPGLINLPPVDRTEVIFAGASRQMLAEGRVLDPSFAGEMQLHRPIGTFWLQELAAWGAGPVAQATIVPYRMPSLAGVAVAVLAAFHLLWPLVGGRTALLAAGYFAIAPVVAVLGDLAVADGVALGVTTIATLALLRMYAADEGTSGNAVAGRGWWPRGSALAFWGALGLSIDINALAAPILCAATLGGLAVLDRGGAKALVRRLDTRRGVPVMAALGLPWMLALAHAQGGNAFSGMANPFAGMDWPTILGMLGGAQVMKFEALPLSFTAVFLLGFMPGTLLLGPALLRAWRRRGERMPRFILAHLGGYLVYLELISSKPALYMVPVLFPLAGLAVALMLSGESGGAKGGAGPLKLPGGTGLTGGLATLGAVLLPAGLFGLYALTGRSMEPWPAVAIVAAGVPLLAGALAMGHRLPAATVLLTLAGFPLFTGTTLGLVLPDQRAAWPTARIQMVVQPVASCSGLPVTIIGYREPSAIFAFGADHVLAGVPGEPVAPAISVVEDRWRMAFQERFARGAAPVAIGCVDAINVTRGCGVPLTIYAPADVAARCPAETRFRCSDEKRARRPACP